MYSDNNRRRKFRSNLKPYRRRNSSEGHRVNHQHSVFNGPVRVNSYRGNHNAQKLIEKYSDLAKEAMSSGDRILSENYFQHADHFSRILAANNSVNNENANSHSVSESNDKNSAVVSKEDNKAVVSKEDNKIEKKTDEKID